MKRTLLLSVGALALAACSRGDAASVEVETSAIERRDIVVDAQATGVIEPIFIVEVKSKSSGQITEMTVEVGSEVAPGDLLVQLDTRDVKNQYDQAAADLAAAQARLEVAKAQRDRNKSLFDTQIITRQEYEASGLEYENARAQIIRSETSLDIARQRLEEATVRAPVTGTVIEKPVSIGQVITSASTSASGGTTILKMADLSKVRVRALVNESDIGQIRAGLPARVTVDAFPDRPFFGTVEKVEPQAVVQQNVTMFPVLVSLSNEAGLLKPGMNGEVSVEIQRKENVLAVPNDAVRTMREVATAAEALGLNPDSVQAQLRAQMTSGRRPGAEGGDTGAGAQVRVARGDVAAQPEQPAQGADPAQPGAAPERRRMQRGADAPPQGGERAPGGEGAPAMGQDGQGGPGRQGGARGGRGGGRAGLVFVQKDGAWQPRMVRLGVSDFDYTEVVSGLEEGESVAMLAVVAMQAQRDERNQQMRERMGGPLPGVGGGAPRGGGR